jgi:hypothetical protein
MASRFNIVEMTNEDKTRTTVSVEDAQYPRERIDIGYVVKGESPDKLTRMQSRATVVARALNIEAKAVKR